MTRIREPFGRARLPSAAVVILAFCVVVLCVSLFCVVVPLGMLGLMVFLLDDAVVQLCNVGRNIYTDGHGIIHQDYVQYNAWISGLVGLLGIGIHHLQLFSLAA